MPTWIRVRDDVTGAHYDVDERSLRPGMTPVDGYPTRTGAMARPRRAKYPADLAGKPARPAGDEPDHAVSTPASNGGHDEDDTPTAVDPAQPADTNKE